MLMMFKGVTSAHILNSLTETLLCSVFYSTAHYKKLNIFNELFVILNDSNCRNNAAKL